MSQRNQLFVKRLEKDAELHSLIHQSLLQAGYTRAHCSVGRMPMQREWRHRCAGALIHYEQRGFCVCVHACTCHGADECAFVRVCVSAYARACLRRVRVCASACICGSEALARTCSSGPMDVLKLPRRYSCRKLVTHSCVCARESAGVSAIPQACSPQTVTAKHHHSEVTSSANWLVLLVLCQVHQNLERIQRAWEGHIGTRKCYRRRLGRVTGRD